MKTLIGIVMVSMFAALTSCGAVQSQGNANSVVATEKSGLDTQTEIKESFKQCLISETLKNPRAKFDHIKSTCHAEGLAKCQRTVSCESTFKTATNELMVRATGIDCDSGYCSVLY